MKIAKNSRVQRGFTILEMMTVIVVIGILASMAYPRYLEVRDRGHIGAAQYDLVHVRAALAIYAADHDGYPEALDSYDALRRAAVDRQGRPYMVMPSGATFRWISYELLPDKNYLLTIQALDNGGTLIVATGDGVQP